MVDQQRRKFQEEMFSKVHQSIPNNTNNIQMTEVGLKINDTCFTNNDDQV